MAKKITHLTYRYPKQNDDNIQEIITAKQEFASLALAKELEKISPKGDFYNHQKLAIRFLTIYPYLLLYQAPGTGKTGIGWGLGEELRKASSLSPAAAYIQGKNNSIRKFIILVPGDNVEAVWKETYFKHSELKNIPSYYQIEHYKALYERLNGINRSSNLKKGSNQPLRVKWSVKDLKEKYDNSAFLLDEVQDMLNRSKEDREMYDYYRWLFSILSNVMVIPATGTPIIMSAIESSLIMNLFPRNMPSMPTSKKIEDEETKEESFFKSANVQELENKLIPYFRGYVSYLQNVKRNVKLVWPKESVSTDPRKPGDQSYRIVSNPMPPLQDKIYKQAVLKEEGNTLNHVTLLQLSNYASDINSDGSISRMEVSVDEETIKQRSIKLQVIRDILNTEHAKKGLVFITTNWLASGIDKLKDLLDMMGIVNFSAGKKGRPALPTTKARRYVVLADDTKVFELTRRYENRHGDYIQVIIASQKGSIGISLNNVLTFIQLDPPKHKSEEEQRVGRILRPESYKALYEEKINAGMSEEEATIEVLVYNLVAAPSSGYNVDLTTYVNNISKDESLVPIRTILKRVSYDAQLTYARNQLNCQEQNCVYGYTGVPTKLGTDTSTYDLLYSEEISTNLIVEFSQAITKELSIDVDEFWQRKDRDIDIISFYRYLSKLVKSGGQITTTTGEIIYLKRNKNTIFIQREDIRVDSINKLNYLPGDSIYSLSHAIYKSDKVFEQMNKPRPKGYPTTVAELTNFLDRDSSIDKKTILNDKIDFIEWILIHEKNSLLYNELIRRYKDKHIFIFGKPKTAITQLSAITVATNRYKTANSLVNVEQSEEEVLLHMFRAQIDIQSNNSYTIFTYYTQAKVISLLNTRKASFDILEINSPEQLVYARLITPLIEERFQRNLEKMKGKPKEGKLWGAYFDPEMIFRIYDNRDDIKEGESGNKTKRTKANTSYLAIDYLDMLVYLGVTLNDSDEKLIANISIPKSNPQTGVAWLEEIKKLTNTEKEEKAAIIKMISERRDYYALPSSRKEGERIYRMFVALMETNKKAKLVFTEYLYQFLKENNMIFIF